MLQRPKLRKSRPQSNNLVPLLDLSIVDIGEGHDLIKIRNRLLIPTLGYRVKSCLLSLDRHDLIQIIQPGAKP